MTNRTANGMIFGWRAWLAAAAGVVCVAMMPVAASAQPSVRAADTAKEIECLAQTIYFEARGESGKGQLAVGHVVMNRVADSRFPRTVCQVVRQGGQARRDCHFSWWCDRRSGEPTDRMAWERSKALAQMIYWGLSDDPTYGAKWFHADYVAPAWRKDMAQGRKIGRHIFYAAGSRQEVALVSDRAPADGKLADSRKVR